MVFFCGGLCGSACRGRLKMKYVDICYECKGYGDDYHVDENGDLICNCIECPFFEYDPDDN